MCTEWVYRMDLLSFFAGHKAVGGLRDATREWITTKRQDLQQVMWNNVGIRRRTNDMAAALESLHTMSLDSHVLFPRMAVVCRGDSIYPL